MTREERENSLHCLKVMVEAANCEDCNLYGTTGMDHCERDCVRNAIEALEQEPCEDIVSSVKDLLSKVRKLCKDCGVEFFFVVPGASEWSITECDHLRKLTAYHKELELAESEG